jgi:D-glycero-alpha-D-manno-heptose-7-phosphate kinase
MNAQDAITPLVTASAPCRIDLGGTLDISTMHLPLRRFRPCTVNIALDLRTDVGVRPYREGTVRLASQGFETAEFPVDELPLTHPLGLLFAVVAYFGMGGIQIHVRSSSPPRSGLGGSSVAAVALIAALDALAAQSEARERRPPAHNARLAHAIESAVAGVPCGLQDQLAAAYGGVNAWNWGAGHGMDVHRTALANRPGELSSLSRHLLVAYCGVPHDSKDINAAWVQQFLRGRHRRQWIEIIDCSRHFVKAIQHRNFGDAAAAMNRETDIRIALTPQVLTPLGYRLVKVAREMYCGARFTGAGGGGCVWALGKAGACIFKT